MNKTKRTAVLFALLWLCASYMAGAQTLKETLGVSTKREYSGFFDSYYYRGPFAITAGAGTSMYLGDLSNGFYGSPGFAFNIGANYRFWPRTVFGVEFQHFSLSGKTKDSTGLSFTGANWGLNFYGRLYLVEDIIRKAPDRRTNKKVKPYITAGLGFVRYKAAGTFIGGSGLAPAFPIGLGVECKISPRFQIIPEFTHTFTFNDKIDGLPKGNGKDGYAQLTIKLQYAPFAPKRKKRMTTAPADPNQHREEHQEWRKKKEKPKPVEDEYKLPGEGTEGEEQPAEETPTEEQPVEETPKN